MTEQDHLFILYLKFLIGTAHLYFFSSAIVIVQVGEIIIGRNDSRIERAPLPLDGIESINKAFGFLIWDNSF